MRIAAAVVAVVLVLGVTPALAQPGPHNPDNFGNRTQPEPAEPEPAEPAPAEPAPAGSERPALAPPGSYYMSQPPVQMTQRTRRYGVSIAVADGLSMGAILTGAFLFLDGAFGGGSDDGIAAGVIIMVGGTASLAFTPALIHRHHGNSSGAWKSIGLRLVVPAIGSMLAAAARDDCCSGPLDSLPALLFVGGILIDWFVLASVEVDEPVQIMPYAAPTPHGGATLGLSGRF